MKPSKRCSIYNMNLFSVIGIAIAATVISVILKQSRPEFALLVSICTGIFVFLFVLDELKPVVDWLVNLSGRYGTVSRYFAPLLKVLGIAYLAQFAAQFCRDAGENALALKVELAGKVIILGLSIPVLGTVFKMIEDVLFKL